MIHVDYQKLTGLVQDVFEKAGCNRDEAERIGRYLVESNLAGHDSHGVIRVPRYVNWLKEGKVVANQTPEVALDSDVITVVDGKSGFGQSVGPFAVQIGIDKAKKHGASIVAIRNSGHLGRIGDWAEMAAAAGQISVHFVNTTGLGMLVAPFGGAERRMSTNPIAIGVPRDGTWPLILDFATSIVAEGKCLVALSGGKSLPTGALIDGDGTLSEDPLVIYGKFDSKQPLDNRSGSGAIRAMGDHKGSGLSIMCEFLGGALTRGGAARRDEDQLLNGMLSIFMSVEAFDAGHFFGDEVKRYVDFVKTTRPAAGVDAVLLPGEPEMISRTKRKAEGVPLTENAWESILETARAVGVSEGDLKDLAA